MGLLPAEIPDIPEVRSEIVPARLARKLAPLFGVPWTRGPFGARTWVCDYNKLTLSEIARGAPMPGRRADTAVDGEADWAIVDRVAVTRPGGALPNEIPNATLNRFGPDTKAAVVLTAANRLLDPVADAIEAALALLVAADGTPLPARLRVVAWAALVLEAFRTQPALVAAAIRARTIQRELLVEWQLPLAESIAALPLTRSEVGRPQPETGGDAEVRNGGGASGASASGGSASGGSASRPRELDLADRTVRGLGLSAPEEIVDRLLRQLMAIGTRQSSSHLWLSERAPGQLAVEALVPPTEVLGRYVEQLGHLLDGEADAVDVLPRIPRATDLSGLPVPARRAVVLGLLAVLRQVRFDVRARERTRAGIVPLLAQVALLATESLGADDPVTVLGRCRVADMTVHTLRHDRRHDLAEPLAELMSQVERCVELTEAGVVDRGAAAEAISSANVEINIVRRTNATDPDGKLPPPAELDDWLQETWAAYRRVLEPVGSEGDADLSVGHHLHNYASYLTTHPDREADLVAGVELFAQTVIPARTRYWQRTRSFLPLRQSLQIASRATTTLSALAAESGRAELARQWAGMGFDWISRALAEEDTVALLGQVSEPAAHFCLLAVPALLTAVEQGVAGAGEVALAGRLLGIAEQWARLVTDGDESSYSHHDRLVGLRARLALLG
ncbi:MULTISPECIES: hypothetical protein [unclassified Crossiella]|uniref:hypothetical protein n=1 Tax=unclassified Crossiella TaxID=2620835 RepID=UPI001FFF89A3|nr:MULTISPECIES: hypothetical protein [unclassified Crossiella]MCK2243622.1 hypothetical protein [Crossiella sp. S99.2]MCK2257480.1 hypothetical protein [Crossiella sp. S99.1]